ncbi:MAG: radical family heme chaperone HemW [Pseudomonadota bacterium]|jgi:oxygen-independent coproporphyrinogen-3 oxidase
MITVSGTGLYLHLPWCERKCPYCDFNSHVSEQKQLPEQEMIAAMLADLDDDIETYGARAITSIFIGGGTPSLLSVSAIDTLLGGIDQRLSLRDGIEITMEANPGSSEFAKFKGYQSAGVNRLSIGVQSFDDMKLHQLGRVHSSGEARAAIKAAQNTGFDRINIDLMYGLPEQTIAQALADLSAALAFDTGHISWYQLTIEPNTVFYSQPPILPDDDYTADIADAGERLLHERGYQRYEVSAYAKPQQQCQHNLNYWQFGDYYGIGAGAHGKLSSSESVVRTAKQRMPERYMTPRHNGRKALVRSLDPASLKAEFMLNALRLRDGVPATLYPVTTGRPMTDIMPEWTQLIQEELMAPSTTQLVTTDLGWRFLNTVIARFLDDQ